MDAAQCIDAGLLNQPGTSVEVALPHKHFAGIPHEALGCCLNTVRKKAEHRQIISLLAQ
jgi:hypothetical protein